MTNFYTLLLMSVSGTIMYLLSRIAGRFMRHYSWQYAMLATSVVLLLIPVQRLVPIPMMFKVTVPEEVYGTAARIPAADEAVSSMSIAAAVWGIAVVLSAARMVFRYIRTASALAQISEECRDRDTLEVYFSICGRMSVKRDITLRTSGYLASPLLFGLFKPVIIIPDKKLSVRELEMILMHELTHYKHFDLWIALAMSAAKCLHWFNPVVYFMDRSINEVCEMFCDETVIKRLGESEKKDYGMLILSVIEQRINSRFAYTTSMASASDGIQSRLRRIAEFRMPTKATAAAGIMAAAACGVSALTAFGFEIISETVPEEIKEAIPVFMPTQPPLAAVSTEVPMIIESRTKRDTRPTEAPEYASKEHRQTDRTAADTQSYEPNPKYTGPASDTDEAPAIEETTDNAAESSGEEEKTTATSNPQTSYVFNADFTFGSEQQSDVFRAEGGTKLSVSKVNGAKDAVVSVHDAATGEVIYDESSDKIHESFSMSVPESGEYYIQVHSDTGESSGIYIYGE